MRLYIRSKKISDKLIAIQANFKKIIVKVKKIKPQIAEYVIPRK